MAENPERLDVAGYWTEIKLQILQECAVAYAQILENQSAIKQSLTSTGSRATIAFINTRGVMPHRSLHRTHLPRRCC